MPILGVLSLAAGARLYGLDVNALWLDEAYSVWFSAQDWHYLWTEVPKFETHPPLYYSTLKIWRGIAGDSEFGLRLLSTLVSLATLPLVVSTATVLGGRSHGRIAGLLAGFLFACSGTQLLASQDARPYAFLNFAMALATYASVRIVTNPAAASRPLPVLLRTAPLVALDFALLGIGVALLAWFHNLGSLFGMGTGLALLAWWFVQGRSLTLLLNFVIAAAIAVLCYLPNLPVILMQMQTMQANGFWLQPPGFREVLSFLSTLPFDLPLDLGGVWRKVALVVIYLILTILGLRAIGGSQRRERRDLSGVWLLPLLCFVPVLLALVLSFIFQPLFLDRTLQPAQIPALIILGFAPLALGRLRGPLMAGLATLGLLSVALYHAEPRQTFYRDLARAIGESPTDGREVIVIPNSVALALDYYRQKDGVEMTVTSLPAPYPATESGYHYPAGGGGVPGIDAGGSHGLPPNVADSTQVWLVMRHAHLFDSAGLVQAYIDKLFPCVLRKIVGKRRTENEIALLVARPADDGGCDTP